MKIIIYILALLLLFGCTEKEKFNKYRWNYRTGVCKYPFRKTMVDDLLKHHPLVGLSFPALIERLGPPDPVIKAPPGKCYYTITLGNERDSLAITSLEIILGKDSTVAAAAIIEQRQNGIEEREYFHDSITATWQQIPYADSASCFQKQYAGIVNGKTYCFNLNLRAINIRGTKDLVIWAQMESTLQSFYCPETVLYGGEEESKVAGKCITCGSRDRLFALSIRFIRDSAALECILSDAKENCHFILENAVPSLSASYNVFRWHKPEKRRGDSVTAITTKLVLAITLPGKNNKYYPRFLQQAAGPFCATAQTTKLSLILSQYKKAFNRLTIEKHAYARSMIGGYNSSEIIYNQDNWLVVRTEKFQGDQEDYGDMTNDYISYDIKQNRILEDKDILISNWRDSFPGYEGFAFVCPLGVAFRTRGNHGWDVEVEMLPWKNIQSILKRSSEKNTFPVLGIMDKMTF